MWGTDDYRVHERTLRGAIDSFLKALVRVRPHQVAAYGDVLEDFAECWFQSDGINQVESIDREWLSLYLETAADRITAAAALGDFYDWAGREGLVSASSLMATEAPAAL